MIVHSIMFLFFSSNKINVLSIRSRNDTVIANEEAIKKIKDHMDEHWEPNW